MEVSRVGIREKERAIEIRNKKNETDKLWVNKIALEKISINCENAKIIKDKNFNGATKPHQQLQISLSRMY